jgi:hypothetical protein
LRADRGAGFAAGFCFLLGRAIENPLGAARHPTPNGMNKTTLRTIFSPQIQQPKL